MSTHPAMMEDGLALQMGHLCEVFMGLRNKTGDPAGAAGEDLLDGTVLVAGVAGIEHEFLISGATICCGID